MKNYKDTLLMPNTDFEMRGNLPKKEPHFFKSWNDINLSQKITDKGNGLFVLHEGPPYANGDLHIGHALNKLLKDFINRSKSMQGHKIHYRHGWDTHGLPIELAVQKKGNNLENNTISQYLDKCRNYALEQVENQKNQMEKFQLVWPLSDKYLTLDSNYEANQIKLFIKMAKLGLIYQALKPVYWSWSVQSALAESEVEYQDKTSQSIYVSFKSKKNDYSAVIWTTTPWTLPGNVAISVNPKFDYGLFNTSKGKVLLSVDLSKDILTKIGEKYSTPIKIFKGKDLENEMFINPINDKESKLILGNHVTLEGGTGLVHTAGGHGVDDFVVAKEYDLEIFSVLNEKGVMNDNAGQFSGQFYIKADPLIIQKLISNDALIFHEEITHSYPHDWRTKKPLVYRATKQWFVNIKKISKELLSEIKKVNWIPSWGEVRMHNMTKGRQDWCISRQRTWGLPIPIIYDENNHPIYNEEILNHIEDLIRKNGSKIWFEKELKDLLPKSIKFNNKWTKETDTMDVWFDSGTSHMQLIPKVTDQIDLYLEGADQYRGWFNTSLITSLAYHGKTPYKAVITHGFVLDAKGNKMSKSKGNVINPLKVIEQFGADVLRLWIANSDYKKDVRVSDDIIKQNGDQYRKIRNTIKFMLGNLFDYDNSKDKPTKYEEIDNLILSKLKIVIESSNYNYNSYEFNKIISDVLNFYIQDLSNFYFDYSKDVLYIHNKDSIRRRQIQSIIYEILNSTLILLAPIIPTTTEEAYKLFNKENKKESIHLENFSDLKIKHSKVNEDKWKKFFEIKDEVYKAMEVSREEKVVTKSINAKAVIDLPKEYITLFKPKLFEDILILAKVEFKESKSLNVKISLFKGDKCERCWRTYLKEKMHDDQICKRCNSFLNIK